MKNNRILIWVVFLLMVSPALMARSLLKPQIVDSVLFKQEGHRLFTVDFSTTSMKEAIQSQRDSELSDCFDQLVEANADDLKPLVDLKGGALFLNAKPKDEFSATCPDLTLIVKLNMITFPQTADENATGHEMRFFDRLLGLLNIHEARAADSNYPGILKGGDFKPSGGMKIVISTATIGALSKVIQGSGSSNCPFCTSDPFGGTGNSGDGTGSGSSSGTGSDTTGGGDQL